MGSANPDGKSRRHKSHKGAKVDHEGSSNLSGTRREVTVVEVRNPANHQGRNKRMYTDYEISLKTNSKAFALHRSSVRRRYSDFLWLKKWLHDHNEGFGKKTPSLPPKKYLKRFDEEFIQERMKGLQRFLKRVIEYNVFLSDKALHLFLQSSLTIDQIEDYLHGKPVSANEAAQLSTNHSGVSRVYESSASFDTQYPPVYVTSFAPGAASCLEEIPERTEERGSFLDTSIEGQSPCIHSLPSEVDSLEFPCSNSQRSSVSEDSSTEADAGIVRILVQDEASKNDISSVTPAVSLPPAEEQEDTIPSDASENEVDINADQSLLAPLDFQNDSGLFLVEGKESPVIEIESSSTSCADRDSGQDSETSSVEGDSINSGGVEEETQPQSTGTGVENLDIDGNDLDKLSFSDVSSTGILDKSASEISVAITSESPNISADLYLS